MDSLKHIHTHYSRFITNTFIYLKCTLILIHISFSTHPILLSCLNSPIGYAPKDTISTLYKKEKAGTGHVIDALCRLFHIFTYLITGIIGSPKNTFITVIILSLLFHLLLSNRLRRPPTLFRLKWNFDTYPSLLHL